MQAGDKVQVKPGKRIVAGVLTEPQSFTAELVARDEGGFWLAKIVSAPFAFPGEMVWIDERLDEMEKEDLEHKPLTATQVRQMFNAMDKFR